MKTKALNHRPPVEREALGGASRRAVEELVSPGEIRGFQAALPSRAGDIDAAEILIRMLALTRAGFYEALWLRDDGRHLMVREFSESPEVQGKPRLISWRQAGVRVGLLTGSHEHMAARETREMVEKALVA